MNRLPDSTQLDYLNSGIYVGFEFLVNVSVSAGESVGMPKTFYQSTDFKCMSEESEYM